MIASLAERALRASPAVPVMIVTGDRDVFQLIDEAGLVKVMATARGITDTKIYDRQAVIDRYGIPPELIPDFYGLKGDTSDNIPGVPGIGDKTASELIQSYGSLEDVLAHIGEISGRQAQTEPARARRERAHLKAAWRPSSATCAVDFDVDAEAGRRARPLAPARGLPRVRAARPAAPPGGGARDRRASPRRPRPPRSRSAARVRTRLGAPARHRRAAGARSCGLRCVRATEPPEGALFVEGSPWRFAVAGRRPARATVRRTRDAAVRAAQLGRGLPRCSPATATDRSRWRSPARARVVVHDAKALGTVPPGLAHDTLLGAYLLEPARRGYPFAELCEERGLASELEDPRGGRRRAAGRAGRAGSASRSPSAAWRA